MAMWPQAPHKQCFLAITKSLEYSDCFLVACRDSLELFMHSITCVILSSSWQMSECSYKEINVSSTCCVYSQPNTCPAFLKHKWLLTCSLKTHLFSFLKKKEEQEKEISGKILWDQQHTLKYFNIFWHICAGGSNYTPGVKSPWGVEEKTTT